MSISLRTKNVRSPAVHLSVGSSAIEPSLQEEAGGDHIDFAAHLLLRKPLLAQDSLCLRRGKALVSKLERKGAGPGDSLGNPPHALRLGSELAAQGAWKPADEHVGIMVFEHIAEASRHTDDLLRGQDLDRHGKPPRRIRDGYADPGLPYI